MAYGYLFKAHDIEFPALLVVLFNNWIQYGNLEQVRRPWKSHPKSHEVHVVHDYFFEL